MLLRATVASWLLVAAATGEAAPTVSTINVDSQITKNRNDYLAHAKKSGMCKKAVAWNVNLDRKLQVPGEGVLAPFDKCVAKNDFGESVQDTSGDIFCQGKTIHLMADAMNHLDSKMFVDRASHLSGPAFNELVDETIKDPALTVGIFLEKLNGTEFELQREPGKDLNLYKNSRFPSTPAFITRIRPQAGVLRAWTKIVHHYWNLLDRTMVQRHNYILLPGPGTPGQKTDRDGKLVNDPNASNYSTTAVRLEHPFVIAGGRFREQYYWDSFFVIEGLLAANMSYLARTTLLNFMDQIKAYGFIPNGARKYYLNRSQPPLFIHMLDAYVQKTKDTFILHEALPLAERELRWWDENRSVQVKKDSKLYKVYQYRVDATGPRPESYAEDWRAAWCYEDKAPEVKDETALYSEFASGAESGWDYTARWMKKPFDKIMPKGKTEAEEAEEKTKQMRELQIRNIVPVDLNSIIYRCHVLMANMYYMAEDNESPFAHYHAGEHLQKADELHEAILDLLWDKDNLAFFDYVLEPLSGGLKQEEEPVRKGEIQRFWSGASLAPYWSGVWPKEFHCSSPESKNKVMMAFAGVRDLLETYPGPLPATLVQSGQQWDFPNSWPPLQYVAIKALENINEDCIRDTTVREFEHAITPYHNLGEADLPDQPAPKPTVDFTTSPSWRDVLVKTVTMRYISAAYCTWNVTGQLHKDRVENIIRDNPIRDADLTNHSGNMFEKLNTVAPYKPGGGGEYEVQTGFGWTNGVAIWIAEQYGTILDEPQCFSTPSKERPDEKSQGPKTDNETSVTLQFQETQSGTIKSVLYGLVSSFAHVLA